MTNNAVTPVSLYSAEAMELCAQNPKGLVVMADETHYPTETDLEVGYYWSQSREEFVAYTDNGWKLLGARESIRQLPPGYGTLQGPLRVTSDLEVTAALYCHMERHTTSDIVTPGFYYSCKNKRPFVRFCYFDGSSWLFIGDHGRFKFEPKTGDEFVLGVWPVAAQYPS